MKKLKYFCYFWLYLNISAVALAMDIPADDFVFDPLISSLANAICFDRISPEQRESIASNVIVKLIVMPPSHFGLDDFPKFFGNRLNKMVKKIIDERFKINLLKKGYCGKTVYIREDVTQKLIDVNDEDFEEEILPEGSCDDNGLRMETSGRLIIALANAINFEEISPEQKNEICSNVIYAKSDAAFEKGTIYISSDESERAKITQLKIMALKHGFRGVAQSFDEPTTKF